MSKPTKVSEIKVGQKFKSAYATYEIMAVFEGGSQVTYKRQESGGYAVCPGSSFITSHYELVEPFFEKDKTYKWVSNLGQPTGYPVKILGVAKHKGKRVALAVETDSSDPSQFWFFSLAQEEFKHYVEVSA